MNAPAPTPRSRVAGNPDGRQRTPRERLSPRQRQFMLLGAILASGIGLLWLVFSFSGSDTPAKGARNAPTQPGEVTNLGVLPPGGQVNPVDQWVGTAGRKLAQYETEREEQTKVNRDRQAFEARTMQRFAELEKRLIGSQQPGSPSPLAAAPGAATVPPASSPTALPVAPPTSSPAASSRPLAMPPAAALPPGLPPAAPRHGPTVGQMPSMAIGPPTPLAPQPFIARVRLAPPSVDGAQASSERGPSREPSGAPAAATRTVSTFLPVSFTRGVLLGGLDAPTGGQSQSNPQPVLIRLSDNSVLPNQFRGEYRGCFVVAAGYGDIGAERAYLRTESLSCVRADGATLEARIQGSVYGEDGKVGIRGRLVTKQGQMLANALLAGVVSGIGQGLSTANTSYSTSPLGTVASTESNADAYRAGLGSGMGKALDRLAQYYIRLAEQTFPVIEVDAGREIDVAITRGVRLEVPMSALNAPGIHVPRPPETRYLEVTDDAHY